MRTLWSSILAFTLLIFATGASVTCMFAANFTFSSRSSYVAFAAALPTPNITAVVPNNRRASVFFSYSTHASNLNFTIVVSPGNLHVLGFSSPIVVSSLNNGVNYTFAIFASSSQGISQTSAPSAPAMPSCQCNSHSSICSVNDTCLNCGDNSAGASCESCQIGYYRSGLQCLQCSPSCGQLQSPCCRV